MAPCNTAPALSVTRPVNVPFDVCPMPASGTIKSKKKDKNGKRLIEASWRSQNPASHCRGKVFWSALTPTLAAHVKTRLTMRRILPKVAHCVMTITKSCVEIESSG